MSIKGATKSMGEASSGKDTIRAEIRTDKHKSGFNSFEILSGLLDKATQAEEAAVAARETVEGVIRGGFQEPYTVEPNEEIRVMSKPTGTEGLRIHVLKPAIAATSEEEINIWRAASDPADLENLGCLRERNGSWRFYGSSIGYDERSGNIWVYNNDMTARVLYRPDFEELDCTMMQQS